VRILIVEDDRKLARQLKKGLDEQSHSVDVAFAELGRGKPLVSVECNVDRLALLVEPLLELAGEFSVVFDNENTHVSVQISISLLPEEFVSRQGLVTTHEILRFVLHARK